MAESRSKKVMEEYELKLKTEAEEKRKQPNVLALSVNGKALKFRFSQGTNLYEFYFEDGGEIPDMLKGQYTHPAEMKILAKKYEYLMGVKY